MQSSIIERVDLKHINVVPRILKFDKDIGWIVLEALEVPYNIYVPSIPFEISAYLIDHELTERYGLALRLPINLFDQASRVE